MSVLRTLGRALALALLLAAPLAAGAGTRPLPSIETFFENAEFGGAALSPSGRHLAALVGGRGHRDWLVVIDLQTNAMTRVAAYSDADVGQFRWVNDERLAYNLTDKHVGPGDMDFAPGLFAVNRDGSKLVQLAARRGSMVTSIEPGRKLLPWHTYLLGQSGAQDSDSIYVSDPEFDRMTGRMVSVRLLHLNTVTGRAQAVSRPGLVHGWMLDYQGEPRLAVSSEDRIVTLHYRDPASSEWRKLATFDRLGTEEAIDPVGFGPDGTLYVVARKDRDTKALYSFDLKTGKLAPEPVMVTHGYDFSGSLETSAGKLLGVHYDTDARGTVWFDPAMKALQQKVDAALPGTINLIGVPERPQTPWVVVRSYSDVVPPRYALFNTQTGLVNPVGESRTRIDPATSGRQEVVRYKARDGMEIPALLTLPAGVAHKNLPLVVQVHGGPWVRGALWGWHPETQFLASRGYAVLEPEFRGSTGLGDKHFKAGFKQWGLKMQDDVADGARWAVAQGIVDPQRICIMGGSYGGYATLMGLINDGDLFKCGIAFAGPTDFKLLYKGTWYASDDVSEDSKKYSMPQMIGDLEKDAAQLTATSPLEQAARITRPLLLAYGGFDQRVPTYHGKRLYDAVSKTNKQVEWIEYPEEGHGWRLEKNRIDYWRRVEQFLDKHIGKAQ